MEVGLENVLQGSAFLLEFFQVGAGFAQGVDDHGLPFAFDVIGCFSQTSGINLFDFHWYNLVFKKKYDTIFMF